MPSFKDLSLSPELLRALEGLGYETPSPIQAETLPILLGDRTDFIGLAATGTGKTAAFALPLIERLKDDRNTQALILCPTRELAMQVAEQIGILGKYKGAEALSIYGGSPYGAQIAGLRAGARVVVGTPGRVIDHLDKGSLRLDNLSTLILDEADEMISMGFLEDIERILQAAPRETCDIWLFSATMDKQVRGVADRYLKQPKTVQVNRGSSMLPSTVDQIAYVTAEPNKPEVLCKLIDAADDFYGLVFCQTKQLVSDLTEYLTNRGYKADALHGDLAQNARERVMNAFRERRVRVLVCTDVAARGLDVKDVSHVVNYSLPRELDNYVHRIGRTARGGKTGFAMSLVTNSHRYLVGRIEQMTKSRIREGVIPTRKEIGQKKVNRHLASFTSQVGFDRAMGLMDDSWKEALAGMTPEEVAGRFLAMAFPDVFAEKQEVEMARPPAKRADGPPPRRDFRRDDGGDRGPRRDEGDRGFRRDDSNRGFRRNDGDRGGFRAGGGFERREGGFKRREGGFEPRGSVERRPSAEGQGRFEKRTDDEGARPKAGFQQRREGGFERRSPGGPPVRREAPTGRFGRPPERREFNADDGGLRSPRRQLSRVKDPTERPRKND